MIKELLISSLEGATKNLDAPSLPGSGNGSGGSHGARGLAAGVGAAALAPVAIKGLGRLAREAGMNGVGDLVKSPGKAIHGLGGEIGSSIGDKVTSKVDEAGGPSGIVSEAVKNVLPFGGGGGGGGEKGGGLGVGKGRRMPVQQSVDIGAPLETVYNQWTQYEDWPKFMHRVVNVSQEDETTVHFTVKIWTRKRDFAAEIETQRPDQRVKWKVSEGMMHAGVVTFHELGPNLTRVLLSIDVDPGGMIEKMARGMRHVKRAARGDLHRFKAFIEMAEHETGAWRGVIEDGEVVEDHDPSYDEGREYSDADEVLDQADDEEENDDEGEDEEEEEEQEQPRSQRRRRQPSANGHGSSEGQSARAASRPSSSRSASSGSASSRGRSSGSTRASGSGSKSKRSGASSGGSRSSRSSGTSSSSSRSGGSNSKSGTQRGRASSGAKTSGRSSSGSSRRGARARGDK